MDDENRGTPIYGNPHMYIYTKPARLDDFPKACIAQVFPSVRSFLFEPEKISASGMKPIDPIMLEDSSTQVRPPLEMISQFVAKFMARSLEDTFGKLLWTDKNLGEVPQLDVGLGFFFIRG